MKAGKILQVGFSLVVLCVLAVHCGDPFLPRMTVITPTAKAVIVEEAVPYVLPVEVRVPQPACGATSYPLDPETFTAELTQYDDGVAISEVDVTAEFTGVQDPATLAWTWSGSLELASFGDYQIYFTVANGRGAGAGVTTFRLEQAVAEFPGGVYTMSVTGLVQSPANCLLNDLLIGVIYGMIKTMTFPLAIPPGAVIGAGYPVTFNIPVLGAVNVVLRLDEENNDIVIDGPDSYVIDLTGLVPAPFTGYDCVITAKADGLFNDTDPADPDGTLTIGILDVQPSPSGNGCVVNPPTGACSLILSMDGDPL